MYSEGPPTGHLDAGCFVFPPSSGGGCDSSQFESCLLRACDTVLPV